MKYYIPKNLPGNSIYKVKLGDNSFKIAKIAGITQPELLELNPGVDWNKLLENQELLIRKEEEPNYHVVQDGEYLGSIALKLGTTVSLLKLHNNLSTDLIYPGDTLYAPGAQMPVVPIDEKTESDQDNVQSEVLKSQSTDVDSSLYYNTDAELDMKKLLVALENPRSDGLSTYKGEKVWYHPFSPGTDKHQFAYGLDDRNPNVKKYIQYDDEKNPYITVDDAKKAFDECIAASRKSLALRISYAKSWAAKNKITYVSNQKINDLVTNLIYLYGGAGIAKHSLFFESSNFLKLFCSGDYDAVKSYIANFYKNNGYSSRGRALEAYRNGGLLYYRKK